MKQEEWNAGLNHLDPDLIEKYVAQKESLQKKKKRIWLCVGAIAACLALIAGAILAPKKHGPAPIWSNARYTAADIAAIFDSVKTDAVVTNAYTKVYVPDTKYLYIENIPNDEFLEIYRYNSNGTGLNRDDFQEFIHSFLPALATSVNASIPQYEIKEDEIRLNVSANIGSYHMGIQQDEAHSAISLINLYGNRSLILDGETIRIDQRLTDAEIIKSLQSVKEKLFQIFGVSFSDAKVIRDYGSYSKHGAEFIHIYFYNEAEHPLNMTQEVPISDNICIRFDNFKNYSEDFVSDGVLTQASIAYLKTRSNITKKYELTAKEKRISLEEAEALLHKGYVFGGHSCNLCMSAQDKVGFEEYDFVDIEYVFGRDSQTLKHTVGIPFYAFYKQIGTSPNNGNLIFAKTYVPAIPVMGLEEYFKSQTQNHRKPIFADDYVIG